MARVDLSGWIDGTNEGDPQASQEPAKPALAIVSPQASATADPAAGPAAAAALAADSLPEPHDPVSDGPLNDSEAAELVACERAIEALQLHFVWGVGRALAVIAKGRLHRATHARFEDYVAATYDGISPARAYQLITAWPVAKGLAKRGIDMRRVNEGQIRELNPVIKHHGVDEAIMVYATVTEVATEVDGARVTAKVISRVVESLPGGHLDPEDVAGCARLALHVRSADPMPQTWEAARDNAFRAVRKIAGAGAEPAEVLAAVAAMRQVLDEIEAAAREGQG